MKRKALIGLGASGSRTVEDIVPYISDMDLYCINSSKINVNGFKRIPEKNQFCFGRESGFSREFEVAWRYLKEDNSAGYALMQWIHDVIEKHEEILFVTHTTSGTGVGSLLYVLQNLKEENHRKSVINKDIRISNIILRYKGATTGEAKKTQIKEWLFLNEYGNIGPTVFMGYDRDKKERVPESLTGLNLKSRFKCSRLVILEILHHKKMYQLEFVEKCRHECLDEMLNYLEFLDVEDTVSFTELDLENKTGAKLKNMITFKSHK